MTQFLSYVQDVVLASVDIIKRTLHKIYKYKFTVVYCESVSLIGYIIVLYLLIENSYASVHIAHHV